MAHSPHIASISPGLTIPERFDRICFSALICTWKKNQNQPRCVVLRLTQRASRLQGQSIYRINRNDYRINRILCHLCESRALCNAELGLASIYAVICASGYFEGIAWNQREENYS
jgi:hypothetical protein